GAVDTHRALWATVLEARGAGPRCFLSSPDPRTLRVEALPDAADPVGPALASGARVGMLGIELRTRRRNRLNGQVIARDERGFTVRVAQSFGNCPQYIHAREVMRAEAGPAPAPAERFPGLDDEARATIAAADTFFVASALDVEGDPGRRAVDVSHRGG